MREEVPSGERRTPGRSTRSVFDTTKDHDPTSVGVGKCLDEAYALLAMSVKGRHYRTHGGGLVKGGVIFSIGPIGRFEGSGPIDEPSGRASRFNRTTSPPMTSHR